MIHNMKLNNDPFNRIKEGKKVIEIRLYDEKRSLIKLGDIIEFTNRDTDEVIKTIVEGIYKFKNFDELFKNFTKEELGYLENEEANPMDMLKYYSKEEQEQYGVVGIKIKLQ